MVLPMRIGLPGGGTTVDRIIDQAKRAEDEGFTSLWFPSAVLGDPLVAMAVAGHGTRSIELGTAVLQTYTCHPALQGARAVAAAVAMGRPGLTLGVGPSHQPVVELMQGLDYSHPGRHTEEYVQVLAAMLRGDAVAFQGEDFRVNVQPPPVPEGFPVPLLVAALGPRLLRVAGQHADGTITWMANARAVASHVAPRIRAAAEAAGRPAPRIVVGLPVAVHDDVGQARAVAADQFALYGTLPNYQRILEHGEAPGPADAAIVGDEAGVGAQIEALFAAGATDVWAAPFPVGTERDDRKASLARTRALLKELAAA
jgi:F420-dependent oxidoreductase-like protein